MRDGEPNMYAALATLRNGYMQTQWQRVQMFLVFNTVALPLIFTSTAGSEKIKLTISIVGLAIHVVILQATLRADGWIKFLDTRLAALELVDTDDINSVRVAVFSDQNFQSKRHSIFASRKFFGLFGLFILAVWVYQSYTFVRLFFDF